MLFIINIIKHKNLKHALAGENNLILHRYLNPILPSLILPAVSNTHFSIIHLIFLNQYHLAYTRMGNLQEPRVNQPYTVSEHRTNKPRWSHDHCQGEGRSGDDEVWPPIITSDGLNNAE